MKRKQYKTEIAASREKVWKVLWDDETYPQWTSAFSEGSKAESDWNEGSRILFVNGEGEGMVSVIEKKIKNELMQFKHLGMIDKDGNEDNESEKIKAWAGAMERYTLKSTEENTEVVVDMDVDESYIDYFDSAWVKAFEKLKVLSEK
ncbi:SRPBCC family protein [Autumnicola musiva]|uniref:SRPBCC domain-containing protein n=1 Tax=Autumnicola musiva TaxID=3075589 RepID=A0ABU3D6W5_9FLAO|nr:SRPBCC domain-containing protein [Zunongwangia sp. F117]MDT0677277.1 SRPBCC domain-containing protein [Zunongwangia sp. F117]